MPSDFAWDFPDPFTHEIDVAADDIDGLGHVNNAVYVDWLSRVAWAHTTALGLTLARYRALDRAAVVTRTEIDYLAPAFAGERIAGATWITANDGRVRLTRRFQIRRGDVTLVRARQTFAIIELSTGKARRMPPEFVAAYRVMVDAP